MAESGWWKTGNHSIDFNEKAKERFQDMERSKNEKPEPRLKPKSFNMGRDNAPEFSNAPTPAQTRTTKERSHEEIESWAIESNTKLKSEYETSRNELEAQQQEARENRLAELTDLENEEQEQVIGELDKEHSQALAEKDAQFEKNWEAQKERVNRAYEERTIPEQELEQKSPPSLEQKHDGREF